MRTTVFAATFIASAASSVMATNNTSNSCCVMCNGVALTSYLDIDFTKIQNIAQLKQNFTITDTFKWGMGPKGPKGTTCYGSASNLKFSSEGLQMIFAGKSATDLNMTGSEIYFDAMGKGLTGLYAIAEIKSTNVTGTSQALLTYPLKTDQGNNDEVDYEILGAQIAKPTDGGLRLTTHDYKNGTIRNKMIAKWKDSQIDVNSLSTSFHKYSLGWAGNSTAYKFDETKFLTGSTKYVPRSSVPSKLILNHGTNGDAIFYGAPRPKEDVVMTLKSLKIYYTTAPNGGSTGTCSNAQDVCKKTA